MIKLFRERLYECFFDGKGQEIFTEDEYQHVIRLRALFVSWLDNPAWTKTKLVEWLKTEYGIEKTKAYADIAIVESMLGNVRNANKTWARYTVTQTILKAIEIAEDKKNEKSLVSAAEALIKAYSLDKSDEIEIDESKLNINFEPTDDIRVLSPHLKPISKEEKDRIKAKLLANTGVTDIDYEDVN